MPFTYHIRRSQRATRVRIVIRLGKVEVVSPVKISDQLIHSFVCSKQQWIEQAIGKTVSSNLSFNGQMVIVSEQENSVLYQGCRYPLVIHLSMRKRTVIHFSEFFNAYVPQELNHERQIEQVKKVLIQWMRQELKNQVELLISQQGRKMQLFPRKISIKLLKSRWGSCSVNNDISINWLLLMAPVGVLEYVVVHELCHILEKNHSNKFWTLVEEHLPNYRIQRNWLKKYGSGLLVNAIS